MSINRRNFIKLLGGATLLTVVPRRVLGGPNHVAPSDQLTMDFSVIVYFQLH